ncbi:DNA polymerase I [Anaplasmataceae bacterium AB001_6]|nr:DNA polymerase I [Anaplasmataceae bacterium AB001_6]
MSKNLFIFDAYNFLFRAYYALPNLCTGDEINVGAIHGFLNMLTKYLADNPDYVIIASDSGSKTFRSDIYELYKMNRGEVAEDLVPQFDILVESMMAFDINFVRVMGYEADDIIASYVDKMQDFDIEIKIFSSDKDLLQLMQYANVTVYDPVKDQVITEDYVLNKFGVKSDKLLDVMSLIGDQSDNIPGVKGIGVKTAAKLINEYGTLDNLLTNTEGITNPRFRNMIMQNKESAILSRELITLHKELDLNISIDDMKYLKPDFKKVSHFLRRYELNSIMTKMKNNGFFDYIDSTDSILHKETLQNIKDFSIRSGKITIVESEGEIVVCTLSGSVFYLNSDSEIDEFLAPILADRSVLKIFIDAKTFLKRFHIVSFVDLQIMAFCCDSIVRNLQRIISDFCDNTVPDDKDKLSFLLFKIFDNIKNILQKNQTLHIYHKIDGALIELVTLMEIKGIKLDVNKIKELSDELTSKISVVEKDIFKTVGREFLIGSVKQLGEALFVDLNLPKSKKLKSGVYSTDADTLEKLAHEGYEIAGLVLKWRHFSKLRNTYTDSLVKHVSPTTGRIHANFNINGAATGRMSSNNPNMQNIPVGDRVREAFIAESGKIFLTADYSQIELRLLAYIADIKELKAALEQGIDIHKVTASSVFGIPIDEVTKEYRNKAKAINFGIIYGITPFGLAKNVGITQAEAVQYIDNYFATYPGIKRYMNNARIGIKMRDYAQTYYGRRCNFSYSLGDKGYIANNISGLIERFAINAPIQGTAADIIKKAMIEVAHHDLLRNSLVLQVHDELVFEFANDNLLDKAKLIKDIMKNASEFPLEIDCKMGNNLGKLEEFALE